MAIITDKVFQALPKYHESKARIFCFHYGGGSSFVFRTWSKKISKKIEVVAATLPGRGTRVSEPLHTSWQPMLHEFIEALIPYLDKPYFFFGHSLGAGIAFELVKILREKNMRMPLQIFVSACQPPHIPAFKTTIYNLPKKLFFERIKKMNGTPTEAFQDEALVKILEPVLRADILLAELWNGDPNDKIDVPITAFSGISDEVALPEEMEAWSSYTTTEFDLYAFRGDHFFLHSNEKTLLNLLSSLMQPHIDRLDNLTKEASLHNFLQLLNDTDVDYPNNQSIADLYENQVIRNPNAIALVYKEHQMSYQKLNTHANQLAHYLIKLGVRPNTLVGFYLDRSFEMVITILAILKTGAAYLPLPRNHPKKRLICMLSKAKVSTIITKKVFLEDSYSEIKNIILIDELEDEISKETISNPISRASADTLAYVNYTSGSTGKPKGVEVLQRGVIRLVCSLKSIPRFDSTKVFLHLAPIIFDAATFEIWGALLHGAKCVLFPESFPTIKKLENIINEKEVTTAFFTASLFNTIIDENPKALSGLKQVLVGGEALSIQHIRKALIHLPHTEIINGYGPTESTTFAAYYPVNYLKQHASTVPIGRPLGNTKIYILDSQHNLAPLGTTGELYIGGAGLARGYLAQPELTKKRFLSSFSFLPEDTVLYKTGDLARYLSDGNIDVLARIDDQIKFHGFRIELTEIENTLIKHSSIKQAAVVCNTCNDEKRLTAYLVMNKNKNFNKKELVAYLQKSLPSYMLPSDFYLIDALPLTANGKLDRNSLTKFVTEEIAL